MLALFASDRANFGTVANPTEKRYLTEDLLKGSVQISAYPVVNCEDMKPKKFTGPVNQTVKADDHKEIQKKNEDSSSGNEHGSDCASLQVLESVVSSMTAAELYLLGRVKDAQENKENMEANRSKSYQLREVIKHLRALGYEAGICKSLGEKTKDDTYFTSYAGDYEYVDVIMERNQGKSEEERLLVDIDFRAQFEIARPTKDYSTMVKILPNIFVGKAGKMKQIIKIMCHAARQSLNNKKMHIPPWREYRYMKYKWLGSYKRTTKTVPVSISSLPPSSRTFNPVMQQKCFQITSHRLPLQERKPPSVNLEAKNSAMNAGGKVSGLTSAFIRAGLTKSFSKVQPTH